MLFRRQRQISRRSVRMAERSGERLGERLESRCMLADGSWFNSGLPGDVDRDGSVWPQDALLVINDLNARGGRRLNPGQDSSLHAVDVNDDGFSSPIDALLVINLLNSYAMEPQVIALVPSDLDGNGVVLTTEITLTGVALPRASVAIQVDRQPVALVTADSEGRFASWLQLPFGRSRIDIQARDPRGRVVTEAKEIRVGEIMDNWNATALNVVRAWTTQSNDPYQGRIVPSQPPLVARNLAMIHVAAFDAANAIQAQFPSYMESLPDAPADASPQAAALNAAYVVASSLYADRDEVALWSAALAEGLASVPDDAARAAGMTLGRQVAEALLQARANDGVKTQRGYASDFSPGRWNRTYPDYLPPLLPQWPQVSPFVLDDVTAVRSPAPPNLQSPEYAQAVDEVLRLGSLNSSQRTAEQTEIALFWADGGGTATPPGHWNRIATDASMSSGLSMIENTRMYALLNLALADAGIASWDVKYAYAFWRPIEAIRRADQDGNPGTSADPAWLPLLKTPPFPAYTSGHSTFSGAAATVLTAIFGDSMAFVSSTDPQNAAAQRPIATEDIVVRQFDSFWQAAQEAGMSRIYGGIHFNFDNSAGLDLGKQVAEAVLSRMTRS